MSELERFLYDAFVDRDEAAQQNGGPTLGQRCKAEAQKLEVLIQQRIQAAVKLERATALEMAAQECDELYGEGDSAHEAAFKIRALISPSSQSALEAVKAEAVQKERDRCVSILRFHGHEGMANAIQAVARGRRDDEQ